jgi:hypothetical protein
MVALRQEYATQMDRHIEKLEALVAAARERDLLVARLVHEDRCE